MKKALIVLGAVGMLVAAGAHAADGAALAKAKGCLNCHAVDVKKVGSSYKDVAAKYKGKNATADITARLKAGKGHPKVSASEDELKDILAWVLAQ